MADLDDFFAKKDRKKSKGTKKFTTTEEVAKKLEDSAKKPEKTQKKERAPEGEEGGTQVHVSSGGIEIWGERDKWVRLGFWWPYCGDNGWGFFFGNETELLMYWFFLL